MELHEWELIKKLVAFIKDEMVHNTKPEVAFSTKGFSILNNVFKALHEEEQDSFFKVLDNLKNALTTALSSCLHYSLVVKCIDQKWFWPELAAEIDITPPTTKPSLMFGKSQCFFIGHSDIRNDAAREIDIQARLHEQDLERIILKRSLDDCTRWKASFEKKFKARFDSTINDSTWLETQTPWSSR